MTIYELANKSKSENYKKIFSIIADKTKKVHYGSDNAPASPISHSTAEIEEIKSLLEAEIEANMLSTYGGFKVLNDVVDEVSLSLNRATKQIVKDGFYNPMSGVGTFEDPSAYSNVSMPLMLGPNEHTSLYANGGVASIIIDKKSKGILLNGYQLMSNEFHAQELVDLKEYADSIGFEAQLANGFRDGNIYGGSAVFPIFKNDGMLSLEASVAEMFKLGVLHKDCIRNFVEVDRWNTVVIPNYDITAADYLMPKHLYVPISGINVNTERMALIRPKMLPYWGTIQQLGWGMSDFVSYIRSLVGYNILITSIPIMAQQMSLLYHEIPLDGIIAQNGVKAAEKWQKQNEEQLRTWSMLHPKAINSFGKLATIERTYTGFDTLVASLQKDVCANSGLPESVLFYTQEKGIFSKTEEDVLLKQSETIRMQQRAVTPAVNKLLPFIAASLWGCESEEQWKKYCSLKISFDTPVVSSPSQKAEIARKYAETLQLFRSAGLSLKDSFAVMTKLAGEVELPEELSYKLTNLDDNLLRENVIQNVENGGINAPDSFKQGEIVGNT